MSGLSRIRWMRRTLLVVLMLSLVLFAGCGGKKKTKPKRRRRPSTPTAKGTQQREKVMATRDQLDKIAMPETMPKEWFYDGDGGFDASLEWKADDGKLTFTMLDRRRIPRTTKGSRKKGKKRLELVLGFYEADRVRGPYRYVARAIGAGATLPKTYGLREVQHKYYKAVVFDASGKVLHQTSPVQAQVRKYSERRPEPIAKKPPKKDKEPADATKQDAKEDAETDAPEKKKLRVAVVPFLDATSPTTRARAEKAPPTRDYLARGVSELLQGFLAGIPEIDTPDPGYTDFILSEQRTHRSRWSSGLLGRVGEQLRANMVLSGNFEVTETDLRVQFSFVNVETKATLTSPWVKAAHDASNDMGADLAKALTDSLKIELSDALVQNFASRWKKLNGRRLSLDAAMRHHQKEDHVRAIEAFEAVKPEEVLDAQTLTNIAESYQHRGQPLKAARLAVLSTHVPLHKPTQSFRRDLSRVLRNAHDLGASLDILADARLDDPKWVWEEAMVLMNQALGGRVVRKVRTGPRKDHPVVPPAWEVTTDMILANPHLGSGTLVVFGTRDKDVDAIIGGTGASSTRGRATRTYIEPARYDTVVYNLETGDLRWQKAKVLSGVATSTMTEDTLFGMGAAGPAAVSLRNGEVLWENKGAYVTLPETLRPAAVNYGRPWWRSFEVHRVGKYLVVWHPQGEAVHVFEAADGKHVGKAYHNSSWSLAGQFFLRKPDGLYYFLRGSSKLEKLTEEKLAKPAQLTSQLRMLADPEPVVQGNMVYETIRRTSRRNVRNMDYHVVASDGEAGEFKWIFPFFDVAGLPPLIADGKLFVPRLDIVTKKLSYLHMIDPTQRQTKRIRLAAFELSLYEPTLTLSGGKHVLVGTQAVVSAETGQQVWINRSLPVTRRPRMVGKYLFVPPVLVDPATGKVVMELLPPPAFNWDRATLASHGDWLVVIRNAKSRRSKTSPYQGRIWAYRTSLKPVEKKPDESTPTRAAARKLTVDEVEKAFMASNISAPVDQLCEPFDRIAAVRYEKTAEPRTAFDYLVEVLKKRPRNGMHLATLTETAKPYVSMAGTHDAYVAALAEVKAAYPANEPLVAKLTEAMTTAKSDKEEAAIGREYFKTVKTRKHDPLADVTSPRSGRVAGVTPPFSVAWTKTVGKTDKDDIIVPTESAVLVLVKRDARLTALRPEDGEPLWQKDKVYNFVTYRGIVYVLGTDLRALMPDKGLTLWKKRLEGAGGRARPMTAGQGRIILALGSQIRAFNWETGAEVYPLDVPLKNWIEVHGPALLAKNRRTSETHAFEAKTGVNLWMNKLDAYDLYDGKIYSFSYDQDRTRLELRLARGSVTTGRLRVTDKYTLAPDKQKPSMMPRPVVTHEHIVAVCGRYLLLINRESGELVAKRKMDAVVIRQPTVSPSYIYLIDAKRDLIAYDVRNELNPSWKRPTTGRAAIAVGPNTLYILDKNELSAYAGKEDAFSEDHLKALAAPSIEKPSEVKTVARKARVKPYRFEGDEAVFDKKGLAAQMALDTSRTTQIAFYQLVHTGKMKDWRVMIDEAMKRLAPGERKTRQLSEDEERTLFAEVIQRREPGSTPILRKMLNSRDSAKVGLVLDLMRTGSRSAYGPILMRVFGDAMDEGEFITATYCAQAVGNWHHEPGVSLLIKGLTNTSARPGLRSACAKALANFDRPEVISALKSVAKEERQGRGVTSLAPLCMQLLVGQGDVGVKAVTSILQDTSVLEENRIRAADALARATGPAAVPALLSVLKGKSSKTAGKLQATAASSLGPLARDSKEAFEALLDVMRDDKTDPYLRNACMNGLGLSGNVRAIPHLIHFLQDKRVDNHKFTRASAYQFLVQITRQKRIGLYKAKWQQWWDDNKDRLLKEAGPW